MNKLLTTISCLAILSFGWICGHHDDTQPKAASPPIATMTLPVDIQMTFLKNAVDDMKKELDKYRPDTVYITKNAERITVPYRVVQRDTLYMPLVLFTNWRDREEQPLDSVREALIKESEDVIHSYEDSLRAVCHEQYSVECSALN